MYRAKEEEEMKMSTRNPSSAIDKNENHAAKSPCNTKKSNAVAGTNLLLVANNDSDANVEEKKCGNKFSNEGSVERPFLHLHRIKQRCCWQMYVVFHHILLAS